MKTGGLPKSSRTRSCSPHKPGTPPLWRSTTARFSSRGESVGIFDAFNKRIAGPIGMEDFDAGMCYYRYETNKSMYPAYHFRMSARDLARFGAMYQKGGVWNGRRVVPERWVEESTTAWSVVDSVSGVSYGYMWTVGPDVSPMAEAVGYPFYYHTGVGVQALVIIPDLKLVIVELYDTDGSWTDPGEVGMVLGMMIINARITE